MVEFFHDAGTWQWRNGKSVVEAADASMPGGEVRAVVTVRQDGALVHRTGVKLTSDRERKRFLSAVEDAGGDFPSGILLALEERIRQDGVPTPNHDGSEGAGSQIALTDPEVWPDPVDGAQLLADLVGTFERFLGLPDKAADALALWTIHGHAHNAADVSPLLGLTSPEKRCGKTTALHVYWRPWYRVRFQSPTSLRQPYSELSRSLDPAYWLTKPTRSSETRKSFVAS